MKEIQWVTIQQNVNDVVLWQWEKNKNFTVRSFYKGIEDFPMNMDSINRIWKIKAPPRVKIFIWLMLRNKILTMDNLIKRGWQTPK